MRLRRPRPTRAVLARCAVPVAALVSGVMVWHASSAAFSSSTASGSNTLSTGEVRLSDDDSGSAAFTATNLKPGLTVARCIRVTSSSTVPTSVRVYLRDVASTNNLADHAQVAIAEMEGDGGFATGCNTVRSQVVLFNQPLPVARGRASYETGAGTWNPSGGTEARMYFVAFALHSNVPNSMQGSKVTFDLVWEARST